jgi:hypothetical protein
MATFQYRVTSQGTWISCTNRVAQVELAKDGLTLDEIYSLIDYLWLHPGSTHTTRRGDVELRYTEAQP